MFLILLIVIAISAATPSGWIQGPGKKEYFNAGREMNFNDGKNFCSDKGGRIIQVESSQENDFVRSLIPDTGIAWLNTKNPEKQAGNLESKHYTWLDGGEFAYTNWMPGLPDAGFDSVVLKDNGLWDTRSHSSTRYIICERNIADTRLDEIRNVLSKISLDMAERETKLDTKLEALEGFFRKELADTKLDQREKVVSKLDLANLQSYLIKELEELESRLRLELKENNVCNAQIDFQPSD